LRIERRSDGVAVLVIDVPGEPVNTLKDSFADDFGRAFDDIEQDRDVKAVVVASGKPTSFVAGADIKLLEGLTSLDQAIALSRTGHKAMERVERCKVPVVAAIAGPCLGGGLELALACQGRVAASDAPTKLGLPEVQLGILPGLGGTQRLPRLVGVRTALDMLLTGKQLDARRALKAGLVDQLCPSSIVVDVAAQHALEIAERTAKRRSTFEALREFLHTDELEELALAENPLGRKLLFDQAKKRLLAKTHGNYPAPEKILEVVRLGLERGMRRGLEAEAQAFGELAVSDVAKRLMEIFFAQQALKKDRGVDAEVEPRTVERVGVLGAGLMGAGIAYVSTHDAGVFVRIKDRDDDSVRKGLGQVREALEQRLARRRITKHEFSMMLNRVTATTEDVGFSGCDVVIEAVFEDLELKRELVRMVEAEAGPETIFASNTSSLPIAAIAAGAQRPERVIGMHYFSPVPKMPLLEVVVTERTDPQVTATCVELGKRQGKVVIVVRDGAGFYTSRILGAFLNEAAHALGEGYAIDAIDRSVIRLGFPVGPFQLLDEVGLDVGAKVAKVLNEAFGARLAPATSMGRLLEEGRLGRKARKGFYAYDADYKKGERPVDPSVYELLGWQRRETDDSRVVAERCLLQMVNEAARCVDEGIVRSPRDADVGAVFGLGFPPFLGGPCRYVDAQGARTVVRRLEELRANLGERFTPAPLLTEQARAGRRFFD
jgi:3-hydroxyacyl-CoA dehydrogenase/enoyl-CoA hydratase/3-hydroxybutyryl-CoA epimerase